MAGDVRTGHPAASRRADSGRPQRRPAASPPPARRRSPDRRWQQPGCYRFPTAAGAGRGSGRAVKSRSPLTHCSCRMCCGAPPPPTRCSRLLRPLWLVLRSRHDWPRVMGSDWARLTSIGPGGGGRNGHPCRGPQRADCASRHHHGRCAQGLAITSICSSTMCAVAGGTSPTTVTWWPSTRLPAAVTAPSWDRPRSAPSIGGST